MSANKWTPGPWRLLPEEVGKDYIRVRGTQLGLRYKVANVITPVYEGVHEREAEQTRANAHLIASAPLLYAALEIAVRQNSHDMMMTGEELRQCVAALAAARGERHDL